MSEVLERRPAREFRIALEKAFDSLESQGYFCGRNIACCQTCGRAFMCANCDDDMVGYVFTHEQDEDYYTDDGKLMLAWGGAGADGNLIAFELRAQGLTVVWDGSPNTRFEVS